MRLVKGGWADLRDSALSLRADAERLTTMAATIQGIFLVPPIAIARLGGSTTPQSAYRWVESPNPRSNGETTIEPDWSLKVRSDATVEPVLPGSVSLRDGALIRPVCPFFELWASVGEPGSAPTSWKEVPVTPDLLTKNGVPLNGLVIKVDAKNFKAFRRTSNFELQFGTFPPLEVRADNFTPTPILAVSPPGVPATRRMIPAQQNIPLGSFQVVKSGLQPGPDPNIAWAQLEDGIPVVNVEVVRFRFTPARGHFYGPPDAAQPQQTPLGNRFAPIEPSRAFLNPNAGWAGVDAQANGPDAPTDTYDGAGVSRANPSLGVVDDTCEARIEVTLQLPAPVNQILTATAAVFVGPPDFAPDRRPFLSLADELNDRAGDQAARTAMMSDNERNAWVQDLFQRVYETASLLNLDYQRSGQALKLTGTRLASTPIANDHTPSPKKAMGGQDALRNPMLAVAAPGNDLRLPLSKHARERHHWLADLPNLRDFITQFPGRVNALVRAPFEAEPGELGSQTTMRMPPFMRNSNALPLTLASWQYDLLTAWVKAIEEQPAPVAPLAEPAKLAARPLSDAAARRRDQVLARIARVQEESRRSGDQR